MTYYFRIAILFVLVLVLISKLFENLYAYYNFSQERSVQKVEGGLVKYRCEWEEFFSDEKIHLEIKRQDELRKMEITTSCRRYNFTPVLGSKVIVQSFVDDGTIIRLEVGDHKIIKYERVKFGYILKSIGILFFLIVCFLAFYVRKK